MEPPYRAREEAKPAKFRSTEGHKHGRLGAGAGVKMEHRALPRLPNPCALRFAPMRPP